MGHSLIWNQQEFEPWGRSEADAVGRQTPAGWGAAGTAQSVSLSAIFVARKNAAMPSAPPIRHLTDYRKL